MSWTQTLGLVLVRPTAGDKLALDHEIESMEWKGSKWGAPRTLTVTLHDSNRGWQDIYTVHDDNYLVAYVNGSEIFRGKIFSKEQTKEGKMTLVAYDDLVYLIKNEEHYAFTNVKASDIVTRMCNDFQIPMGSITDTGYVIPKLTLIGRTLYDSISKAIKITYDNTGVKYFTKCINGQVALVKSSDMAVKWILEEGTNIITWQYSRSMENMVTKVKLEGHDLSQASTDPGSESDIINNDNSTNVNNYQPSDNVSGTVQREQAATDTMDNSQIIIDSTPGTGSNTITAIATDDTLIKQFGIIQHYERSTNNLNQGQLQAQANQMMQNLGKVTQTFTIDAMGIIDVVAGGSVYVSVPYLNVKKAFYVMEDTHTFTSNSHKMTLTLQETDELPDIDPTDDSSEEV